MAALVLVSMVMVSAACATTIRSGSTSGPAYTGTYHIVNASGTNVVIFGPFGPTITCTTHTEEGDFTTSNGSSVEVTATRLTGCNDANNNSCTVTTYDAAGSANWTTPWTATVAFDALHTGGRDGTMTMAMGASGKIRTQCGIMTCDWVGSGASHTLTANMFNSDNSVRFSAGLSSLCGSATFSATLAPLNNGSGTNLFVTA